MADNNWIQEVVGRVVSRVLESQVPVLRDELVRRVLEELQPNLGSGGSSPKQLLQAISAVRQANGQKEILSALLDGASQFSSRAALFVVRGSAVVGWQARGFANNESIKNFSLDGSRGLCARLLQEKQPVRGAAEDLDVSFTENFAAPEDNRVFLLPLLLKEKVAAVLYADAGPEAGGQLDDAALEMLALSSGLWLEIVALRRATSFQESAESVPTPVEKTEAVAVESAPPVAEPPEMAAAPEMPVRPEPVAQVPAEMEPVAEAEPEPAPMAMAAAAAFGGSGAATIAAPVSVPVSAEDDAVLRKARRFAKLLVDEIKLYNKNKVQEGKQNRDLYQRLKDDIEKSRAAYEKRYGSAAPGAAAYFDQEIIQNLADNDRSLLGDAFSR